MTNDRDIEASGLLDGLEGDARQERAELLAWLLDHDFSIDHIRQSIAPMLLPAGRSIGDDGTYVSEREISESVGVDLELFQRLRRAAGLPRVNDPDARVYLRADGAVAERAKNFLDVGLSTEQVLTVARVLSEGLGQAAEVMRQAALEAVLRPGATELQIAQSYETLARQLSPLFGPMVEDMLRLQLRHVVETEAVNAAERAAGTLPGARQIAVAFADLVGFTPLGEAVPPQALERLASRLADLARDVAVTPVRFIKSIGDAVMLMSPDPVALLDAMLQLVDVADTQDLPQLRVGIAAGRAVSRAGDWFGVPVNVASRVTSAARPGSVLVAQSARDAIGEDQRFAWSNAGSRQLKGVNGETKLFRSRLARQA